MILRFIVEFLDDQQSTVAVACGENATVLAVVSALRKKLRVGADCRIQVRLRDGAPAPPTASVRQLGWGLPNAPPLYALVDEAIPTRSPDAADENSDETVAAASAKPAPGKVTTLGAAPALPAGTVAENDDDGCDSAGADHGTVPCGLHSFVRDGKYWKAFAKRAVAYGSSIEMEVPILCVAYPTQLVEVVRSNPRLLSLTSDPNAGYGPSSISGVADALFARCVSIALTHGIFARTHDEFDRQLALFPSIGCVRHSCVPNAAFLMSVVKPPYAGRVVCVAPDGLHSGDPVTMLYPAVSGGVSMEAAMPYSAASFLLLPRDRRQAILQHRYHFTCRCERCQAPPSERKSQQELEATLTGAFFRQTAAEAEGSRPPASEREQTAAMRAAFDAFGLMTEGSSGDGDSSVAIPAGLLVSSLLKPAGSTAQRAKVDAAQSSSASAAKLRSFLAEYGPSGGPLQLHAHHWRCSFVRLALLALLSAPDGPKPAKSDFEAALLQLQVEALFVPAGHPAALPTVFAFRRMVGRLPAQLAAAIQKKALATPGLSWESLQHVESVFSAGIP